jgi:hypothetical protein
MLEPGVARGIEDADEPGGEESPLEFLGPVPNAGEEAQDLRRRVPAVFSLPVCPVLLGVVALHPPVVRGDVLLPASGPLEVEIGHSALNVERRFDKVLPRPAAFDLLFGYA